MSEGKQETESERQKRSIRNDIQECIDNSKKALEHFDDGDHEKALEFMEEVEADSSFTVAELETMVEEAEEKKETAEAAPETTPPPQPSPPEPISAPAESPV